MSILDESGRAAESVEIDPTLNWDDLHRHLLMHAGPRRPVLRCRWVRDPHGHGMISVWTADPPAPAESF